MFDHFSPPARPPQSHLATLVDVTLRDGGFEVGFHWPPEMFGAVPRALGPVGVDIVEIGYIGGVPSEHGMGTPGIGAHLTCAMVADAAGTGPELAAMIHPTALRGEIDLHSYRAAGLGMVRLVYHPDWFGDIGRIAALARATGLRVTVNIALASRYELGDLIDHARRVCERAVPDVLYIADTCGSFTPDRARRTCAALRIALDVPLGFHAHDFLTLAYANALAAVDEGVSYVDCSVLGLGRGGGNLQSEVMLASHRLGAGVGIPALAALQVCRGQLAEIAHRPLPDLVALACGALNLTPVEEAALHSFADQNGIAPTEAALWLMTVYGQVDSLRDDDLSATWSQLTALAP